MIELRDVTKEYSKGNAALNGVSVKIEQGEFVFIRRRQRFRKIHIDSSDHEGTGAYRRHDHCKRAEFKTDETSEHCKIQKRHRGCLSGFPSVEGPEYL